MNEQRSTSHQDPDGLAGPDILQTVTLGVKRSRKWLIPLVILGTFVGLYFALSQTNVYTSEAKLLLRSGSRERVTSESLVTTSEEDRSARPTTEAEIEMLRDQAIYQKVARTFGPAEILKIADPTRDDGAETPWAVRTLHSMQAWVQGVGKPAHECTPGGCQTCIAQAVDVLTENVALEGSTDSNVIRVTYRANSAERARAVTQALVAAYVERHVDQFSVEPVLEMNRPKVESAKQRRDEAAQAYFDHVRTCNIIDIEVQRRVLIEAGALLERDYNAAMLKRDEVQAERTAVTNRMNGLGAQINLVRESAPNPTYLALKERVNELDVDAATNSARLERLSSEVASQRTRIEGLRECERTHAALGATRDFEAARSTELMRRFSQLEDLGSIDLHSEANLLVLQQPTLNFKKDGPKREKIILAAFAFSLVAGIWLAAMREFFDRRLRHGPTVERQLGVRLLGTIPEYNSRDLAA
ncbi:MAG: hypothetical protein SGI72_10755 [Planctomycetota bacterium]|nr:hypothetical protein [Planctomycetota bacterium]